MTTKFENYLNTEDDNNSIQGVFTNIHLKNGDWFIDDDDDIGYVIDDNLYNNKSLQVIFPNIKTRRGDGKAIINKHTIIHHGTQDEMEMIQNSNKFNL